MGMSGPNIIAGVEDGFASIGDEHDRADDPLRQTSRG
jgi:hypothetical protein